jgi:hypothetical protein
MQASPLLFAVLTSEVMVIGGVGAATLVLVVVALVAKRSPNPDDKRAGSDGTPITATDSGDSGCDDGGGDGGGGDGGGGGD